MHYQGGKPSELMGKLKLRDGSANDTDNQTFPPLEGEWNSH